MWRGCRVDDSPSSRVGCHVSQLLPVRTWGRGGAGESQLQDLRGMRNSTCMAFKQERGVLCVYLADVQTLLPYAGGHQGVEGALPEICQDLFLLLLSDAGTPLLATLALPHKEPAPHALRVREGSACHLRCAVLPHSIPQSHHAPHFPLLPCCTLSIPRMLFVAFHS